MKQYLNFADNRQLYAHGAGAVHFHGVRPDAPGQWKWGTDTQRNGKTAKSTACRTDRRCRSGKSTAHGYNAPCFEGMVHCFMSFVLMGWDTADGKDRI